MQLVDAQGVNHLVDGDFESPLAGAWNLAGSFTNSALSTSIKHSGNASLHLVASAGGTGAGDAVSQIIQPALTPGQSYTLSFWYRQNTNPIPTLPGCPPGILSESGHYQPGPILAAARGPSHARRPQ